MDDAFRDRMKEVCRLMMEEELKSCAAERERPAEHDAVLLDKMQTEELAKRITALLPKDQSLLYFHYCFRFSDQKAEEILGVTQAFEKRIFTEKVLAAFMGLESGRIAERSMELASEKALEEYTAYHTDRHLPMPAYSHKFRKQLKKIRAAQKTAPLILRFAKQAAVIAVAAGLTFSTAMVVNADFREMVFEWVVETFPEFTRFRMEKIRGQSGKVQSDIAYKATYIPEGFKLADSVEENTICYYRYMKGDEKLSITWAASPVSSAFDTENIEVEYFEFRGISAYRWSTDDINYMVWMQDDIQFSILSTLDQDEILLIADKIKKN